MSEFRVIRDDPRINYARSRPFPPDPELRRMRGLTLTQPWASLMALGEKTIETRSWKTDHRGLVAIHAAKGLGGLADYLVGSDDPRTPRESDLAELCDWGVFSRVLEDRLGRGQEPLGGEDIARLLPRGQVVAVGRLVSCLSTGGQIARGTLSERRPLADLELQRLLMSQETGRHEMAFGDYSPGRWAWVFKEVVPIVPSYEVRSPRFKRGLWEVSLTEDEDHLRVGWSRSVWDLAAEKVRTALDSRALPDQEGAGHE